MVLIFPKLACHENDLWHLLHVLCTADIVTLSFTATVPACLWQCGHIKICIDIYLPPINKNNINKRRKKK